MQAFLHVGNIPVNLFLGYFSYFSKTKDYRKTIYKYFSSRMKDKK